MLVPYSLPLHGKCIFASIDDDLFHAPASTDHTYVINFSKSPTVIFLPFTNYSIYLLRRPHLRIQPCGPHITLFRVIVPHFIAIRKSLPFTATCVLIIGTRIYLICFGLSVDYGLCSSNNSRTRIKYESWIQPCSSEGEAARYFLRKDANKLKQDDCNVIQFLDDSEDYLRSSAVMQRPVWWWSLCYLLWPVGHTNAVRIHHQVIIFAN